MNSVCNLNLRKIKHHIIVVYYMIENHLFAFDEPVIIGPDIDVYNIDLKYNDELDKSNSYVIISGTRVVEFSSDIKMKTYDDIEEWNTNMIDKYSLYYRLKAHTPIYISKIIQLYNKDLKYTRYSNSKYPFIAINGELQQEILQPIHMNIPIHIYVIMRDDKSISICTDANISIYKYMNVKYDVMYDTYIKDYKAINTDIMYNISNLITHLSRMPSYIIFSNKKKYKSYTDIIINV